MKHFQLAIAIVTLTIVVTSCGEPSSRTRYPESITAEPIYIVGPSSRGATTQASTTVVEESAQVPEVTASITPAPAILELKRLEMALGVESHEPVGASDRFTVDGRPLYAFLQVVNRGVEEREVVITYERDDGLFVGPARLTVPSSSRGYRTFTRTTWLRQPGTWTVSVSTPDGEVLGQAEFVLTSV